MVNVLPGGVLVALATPVDESGRLDRSGLDRLLERVLAGGVVGVCPAGSTGEGARLGTAGRLELLAAVRERVPADRPVVTGLPVTTVDEALAELPRVAEAGADGVLVAPPSYYPATDDDLLRLYTTLADASPVPLVLYNIPVFTTVPIPPAVVAALAEHPRIAGIKDSSRDLEYLEDVLYRTSGADFRIVTGSDTMLLASLVLGAHGTIAASANLVPSSSVRVYDACLRGDMGAARDHQRALFEVVQTCRRGGPGPVGWKAALEIAGVCSARLVPPAARVADDRYDALKDDLARLL